MQLRNIYYMLVAFIYISGILIWIFGSVELRWYAQSGLAFPVLFLSLLTLLFGVVNKPDSKQTVINGCICLCFLVLELLLLSSVVRDFITIGD